jgi:hypothetical protein
VLLDRRNWAPHLPWALFCLLIAVVAIAWFMTVAQGQPAWPGGSSLPGLTFGVLGGLIILFELLLWWRKKVRSWRLGRAQVWLRAHIWFGLLCLPLLVLHSGLRFGGWLSTVLMILLILVIASGIYGLCLQQLLPTRMLENVPSETIYSQIPHVVDQFCHEAERLVMAICGPEETAAPLGDERASEEAVGPEHLIIGAVRSAGRVAGKVLETRSFSNPVPGSESLRLFFRQQLEPYLRQGDAMESALRSNLRAGVMFQELRTRLDPKVHDAVSLLENLCEQRRQFDEQAHLQFWLHSWLWLHLPLSVALIVLMILHVVVAVKYW